MVHGPWGSTFDGVGTLLFDVLPITIGASPLGQCHNLPLMTKMFLCGGACLYTAVTSSKIAREGLPSNGTSARAPHGPLFADGARALGHAHLLALSTSPRHQTEPDDKRSSVQIGSRRGDMRLTAPARVAR